MTLDNWHNMGYGKVVAFYTPEGKPIRAYELSDLFTKSEIEGFGTAYRPSGGVNLPRPMSVRAQKRFMSRSTTQAGRFFSN